MNADADSTQAVAGPALAADHPLAEMAAMFTRNHAAVAGLALLVFTYREMGLEALSDAARRVLALNFPQSRYLAGTGRATLVRRLRRPGDAGKGGDIKMLEPVLTRFGR